MVLIFYCNDTFYVGIYLFYLYLVLTCIFYRCYITVYVRVDVIDGPLKITQ